MANRSPMAGDDYYTTYEAALAVVATGMKKARLPYNILVLNSVLGGMFFSSGGMLQVMIEANNPGIHASDPGVAKMINGFMYPIGLFFVVMMGVDLFNSNILFFTVAGCRRAVSVVDILVAWVTSYWLNLVGNLFVCYIFVHYSGSFDSPEIITYTQNLVDYRANLPWHQTFIRGIAGNFYVCLAIYLQLLVRPIHVKFLMLILPLFTFVSLGFVHSIAEVTIGIIGLINGCQTSVGRVAYNLFLPASLGNIVGGCFFGVVVVWYLHLHSVEADAKRLKLPKLGAKDVQPQILMDSRIVREEMPDNSADPTGDERVDAIYNQTENLERQPTRATSISTRNTLHRVKSPKNAFPVSGMGDADEKERQVAGDTEDDGDVHENELISQRISNLLTHGWKKRTSISHHDIESHINQAFSSSVSPRSPRSSGPAPFPQVGKEVEGSSIDSGSS